MNEQNLTHLTFFEKYVWQKSMQHENRNPINLNTQHPDALTPSADLMSIAIDPDIHM